MAVYTNIPPSSSGAITTDATLTGAGTIGSPLGVNPTAAQAPDITSALPVLFQQASGVAPYAWKQFKFIDFANVSFPPGPAGASLGFQLNAGTAITFNVGRAGIVKVTGSTSFGDWTPQSNQSAQANTIGNLQTKRWFMAYPQVCIGTTPASTSKFSAGILSAGGIYVGLGYTGAQTNWQYVRGAVLANITDTGVPITTDATGQTNYICPVIMNLGDGFISYIPNALTSRTIVRGEAISNLPNDIGQPYFSNASTVSNTYFLGTPVGGTEF